MEDTSEEFAKLYTSSQSRLYAFIFSLTGNAELTADLLQETNIIIWQQRDRFEIGTNFIAWSFRIARYQVMAYRKKQSSSKLVFNTQTLDALAQTFENRDERLSERLTWLESCIDRLPIHIKAIILKRYNQGLDLKTIAENVGKPYNAISQAIHRARKSLAQCVKAKEAASE